jgi:capsular exopolysaccharide synthesis family protein
LGSYLAGEGAWQGMAYQTVVLGLYVLLCGPLPVNPAELISSDRMRSLLKEATTEYDFVILDSPPLLDLADTRILASLVEATILVVKGGDTPRQVVQYAQSQARAAGANLIGVVLNDLVIHSNGNSRHAYSYSQYTNLPA